MSFCLWSTQIIGRWLIVGFFPVLLQAISPRSSSDSTAAQLHSMAQLEGQVSDFAAKKEVRLWGIEDAKQQMSSLTSLNQIWCHLSKTQSMIFMEADFTPAACLSVKFCCKLSAYVQGSITTGCLQTCSFTCNQVFFPYRGNYLGLLLALDIFLRSDMILLAQGTIHDVHADRLARRPIKFCWPTENLLYKALLP